MSAWREQALIDAPVGEVWSVVGDPRRYPEWARDVLEVTGLPEVSPHARFQQVTRGPLGRERTTFEIEDLEELREIRLRCQKSGFYSHWILTEAQSSTFAEVELGVEPTAVQYRLYFGALGRRYFRRLTQGSIDGLQALLSKQPGKPGSSGSSGSAGPASPA